jgi:predicted permease
MLQDVRYAVRLLGRNPGFAAVAILSLALGIGANSAVFSLLNAVALRELPVPRPDRLVSLTAVHRNGAAGPLSFPMFEAIARDQQVFGSIVGEWGGGVLNVEVNGVHRLGALWAVTGNFHSELAVVPHAGRLLAESDVNLQSRRPEMVAVLGYGIWRREFGGDPNVIGRTVNVDGVPFTIVGIGPRGFTAFGTATEPDVTIPLTALPQVRHDTTNRFGSRGTMWLDVIGRLKDDVPLSEARAQLLALWPRILSETAPADYTGARLDDFANIRLEVASASRGRDYTLRRRLTQPLTIVLGIAGLILLIACVNLASLMISRAAARSHELSVRMALGASRWRLARQMLIEGLLLSAIAAFVGLLFAGWTSEAFKSIMTRDFNVPAVLDVSPDGRVFALTSALAVAAAVLFTLVPAWRATRHDPATSLLLRSARAVTSTARVGKILIVSEVALSVTLLMAAVLLVRTLQQLRGTDMGFRRDQVTIAARFPGPTGYDDFDGERYYPALLERIAGVPGVADAAIAKLRPGDGSRFMQRLTLAGAGDEGAVTAYMGLVGPGTFRVLDMPLISGRDVEWRDGRRAPRVAIVSRTLAARMFPDRDPLGGRLRLSADPLRGEAGGDVEVVGVVKDVRLYDPRDPNMLAIYVPVLQDSYQGTWGDVLIRSAGTPVQASDVRTAIQSLGRETVLNYRTLHQLGDRAILQERVTAMLAGFFGGLALALSGIGLYGLMAYSVTQRTRELAIRRALGARPHDVVTMVVRETLVLVVAGIGIGLPLAVASGWLVRSLLFGLTPGDPVALAAIASMLLAVGLLAGYLPARRAIRVQPMDVLRT